MLNSRVNIRIHTIFSGKMKDVKDRHIGITKEYESLCHIPHNKESKRQKERGREKESKTQPSNAIVYVLLCSFTFLSTLLHLVVVFCFSFSCAGHPGCCQFFYWINNICNSIGENGIFSHCVYAIAICHLGRFCVDINVYDEGICSSLSWYDSDDESPQISKRKAKERPNGSVQMKNWQCPQRSKIVTTAQYNTTHIHMDILRNLEEMERKKSVHFVVFVLVFIFQPDMNATIALQNVHDLILKTLTIVHFRYDRKIMHHFSFLPHFQHRTQSNKISILKYWPLWAQSIIESI